MLAFKFLYTFIEFRNKFPGCTVKFKSFFLPFSSNNLKEIIEGSWSFDIFVCLTIFKKAILVFFSFSSFLSSFWTYCQKMFRQLFEISYQGCMWLHALFLKLLFATCVVHGTVTSIHNIQKSTENSQKHETRKQVSWLVDHTRFKPRDLRVKTERNRVYK